MSAKMSKATKDNDNLRNDIYENLPCQAMYNESVRKIQQQKQLLTSNSTTTNTTITTSAGAANAASLNSTKGLTQQQQLILNNGGSANTTTAAQQQHLNANNTHTNNTTHSTHNNSLHNNMLTNANAALSASEAITSTNKQQKQQQQQQQQHQHNVNNSKHYAVSNNMSKEMLYATPLRKSDRYKSGERSRYHHGGSAAASNKPEYRQSNGSSGAAAAVDDVDSKLSNLMERAKVSHQAYDSNRLSSRNGNAVIPVTDLDLENDEARHLEEQVMIDDATAIDGCSSSALVGGSQFTNQAATQASLMTNNSSSTNQHLEDARILNFLKDTTQLQKKLEVSGRDCPNANFSNLAREEHFANLVQQNFPNDSVSYDKAEKSERRHSSKEYRQEKDKASKSAAGEVSLEAYQLSKARELNGVVSNGIISLSASALHTVYIQREWVLKKIALCLEQRTSCKKAIPPGLLNCSKNEVAGGGGGASGGGFLGSRSKAAAISSSTYNGCLILGSNGSGKTTICQAIMKGNSGTKGILNRKLLACYLIESQNPECHSLSLFIRKIVLQILSHSSLINKDETQKIIDDGFAFLHDESGSAGPQQDFQVDDMLLNNLSSMNDNVEDMLINELKKEVYNESVQMESNSTHKSHKNHVIMRQKSEPEPAKTSLSAVQTEESSPMPTNYDTHPPKNQRHLSHDSTEDKDNDTEKNKKKTEKDKTQSSGSPASKISPGKKSKIPVKASRPQASCLSPIKLPSSQQKTSASASSSASNNAIQQGGGEDIADLVSEDLKSEIEKAINDEEAAEDSKDDHKEKRDEEEKVSSPKAVSHEDKDLIELDSSVNYNEEAEITLPIDEADHLQSHASTITNNHNHSHNQNKMESSLPPPLPKNKSCRTLIADGYYELLISNPEILECLNSDNIEKNPDECFKKVLLFPLLELNPPKTALLLLIDSIDENYMTEGNLISTLKGGRGTNHKSRNVAELLSNHIHLFPKWLFLVGTTKKQTKQITKMFTGFKKITLDDLRKSHVVKDVQEYIINRLNTDFKDSIMLTKEIIESLHQLYIKSNGCILYLEKVLNGIKDNFFSFREIKLIPCTLNGLYLYICQKSFNKKQYMKIRPLLNILLATSGFVDKLFLFNCLRTHNYTIDCEEFEKRLELMRNVIAYDNDQKRLKIFHNSFADWLVDVKFATKKFICDVNEGHVMISMYYILVSDTLCANAVRRFVYHLIKAGEYLANRQIDLDMILILLESRLNLSDCFYTNHLNCCAQCECEFKNDQNFLSKTRAMIDKFLSNDLSDEFAQFLCDFFKPSLPTDPKILKLLIETGINNADTQNSCESSLISPELSEKSQNIDFELADLLISSEKTCMQDTQRATTPSEKSEQQQESQEDNNSGTLHQLSDSNRIELHKGKALIHILANDGNHQLLERALNACKSPIDLEIEDYNGQTALNIAARNGHLDVVKLLLTFSQPLNDGTGRMKRVDVNHADRDGWTPLRSASWGGHTEVVKLLIAQPSCKIDLADKEGRTALRAAAWSGHEDILKILIESGADVNSVDRQGRTSLIAASYMGHYDIVEILLENGANVNHLDLDGRSALCVAALCGSSGYSKVISTLLDHGANTDQLDNDGMSPLLVSSFEGNAEVCELLLENGADPDLADFMGRTPLWAACTAGHANVVKLLLFWGCGIDCMDSEGRTVLSIAAAQGNMETVRQLLDRGLDETHRDNAGWTPLHYAAFEGFHEVCMQLLESGAKIDECDNEGKTALHLAAQEGRLRCVHVLLEVHSAFVDQKAHDGKTAFRLACLEGHLDTVQYILKFCCDVNAKDADGRTTLYILALENKLDIVKYLLEVANIDANIPDSEGRTALHVAAWQGHPEMVKLLITMGNADVNAMDLEARTPLHSCAWQGNHDVMNILLYFGASPDHSCKQGATALGISAQEGHEKCVVALLQYGANPYKSDHCGRTPIKLAAKSNRSNILKIFETYTKNEQNNPIEQKFHPNMLRSPDQPPSIPLHQNLAMSNNPFPAPHASASSVCSAATTATVNNLQPSANLLNASSSTHSSNNFYQNTMQSDASSLHKRKSVISSQSTGSSNDQAPLTFTQQLQRQTKLSNRNNPFMQNPPMVNTKHGSGHHKNHHHSQRHSQVLPDLNEHQLANNMVVNDADLYDMECMSPLYATPPHSPSSELSSPGQLPALNAFDDMNGASSSSNSHHNGGSGAAGGSKSILPDNHFARDTHMRIILGNLKENQPSSSSKPKRSGITSNPAMRLLRSRFDSAAQLIKRTNILSSNSNQGSSSISVKSGTFQWRKESQM